MVRRIPGRGGEGEAYLRQLRRSAALARDRVVFRGPIFETAVLEGEFRAARIFAYPSLATRGETFGLAPLEAMTHRCAVLVSDLNCFRDFILPNETGFALMRRIRTTVDAGRLPAAALSAYVDGDSREHALNAGFQTYLSKPIEPTHLAQTLASLLHREVAL